MTAIDDVVTVPPAGHRIGTDTIDRAVTAVVSPDASVDAVAYLLRQLGQIEPLDLVGPVGHADLVKRQSMALGRYQALCWLAARTLDAFDPEVRGAPASGLAEVVRESMQDCVNPLCGERVAPWADSACSPSCARQAHLLGED